MKLYIVHEYDCNPDNDQILGIFSTKQKAYERLVYRVQNEYNLNIQIPELKEEYTLQSQYQYWTIEEYELDKGLEYFDI
jgi:hypothetical protein